MPCPFIEETTEYGETKCRYDKEIDELLRRGKRSVIAIGRCFENYTKCSMYKKHVWGVS